MPQGFKWQDDLAYLLTKLANSSVSKDFDQNYFLFYQQYVNAPDYRN
jgi:hypothetical protein